MQYQYLHEVLRLLVKKSDQNPRISTSFFDEYDHLIGFSYCCTKKNITIFNHSFENIIDCNPRYMLIKDDFVSKIVYSLDKAIFIDYLFSSFDLNQLMDNLLFMKPNVEPSI